MRSAGGGGATRSAFLSNIDGEAFDEAVATLDPATTLVVVASKTFTTTETMANVDAALDWLRRGGVDDPYGRLIALTAEPEAAVEAGIDETRVLPFARGRRRALFAVVRRSAFRRRWRSAGTRSRNCSKARRRWTAISASPSRRANVPLIAAFADRFYVAAARVPDARGVRL